MQSKHIVFPVKGLLLFINMPLRPHFGQVPRVKLIIKGIVSFLFYSIGAREGFFKFGNLTA